MKKFPANAWIITPEQCRAGRGWLSWSQTELARRARISLSTIYDFERGHRTPTVNNLSSVRRALEEGGIKFLFGPDGTAAGIARQDAEIDLSADSAGRPS